VTRDSVLVTGGARGLGTAIAAALHAAGFNVAIGDIDGHGAATVAQGLDPSGATATALTLDVRDEAAFVAARDTMIARWGSVEALVNNAALTAAKPVLDITADEFDAVMAVNLRGTFLGCQVFGRMFKANGYGRIVNLASLAGQNGGTATGAHYATAKGGIVTMTKVFARDLAPFGVTANAIAPGPLDTPIVHQVVPEDRMAQFLANIPVGRLGDVAFIASMVARLCARDAGFMTGATVDINGGVYMR
jgi:3-oxoacyl-[acyl-carrier protein] reductase